MQQIRREQFRDGTREQIKAIARQHMATEGTASLSLRAIARDLGVSAPALYRYFASRDDLITALILDAFNALADAMEAAGNSKQQEDYVGRCRAIFVAYRNWAREHPVDFQLIYGNPIPGYHAPAEITGQASARSFVPIINAIQSAMDTGKLRSEGNFLPGEVAANIREMNERYGLTVSELTVYLAVEIWAVGYGLVMLEMFNHLQPVVGDTETFFQFEMEMLLKRIGLTD